MTQHYTLSEYQNYIKSIMVRLMDEKAIQISDMDINKNIHINLLSPEWFLQLDENIQEIVISNLTIQYKKILQNREFKL